MSSDENRHSDTATPPLPTIATGAVAPDVEPLTRDVESVSLDDWVQEPIGGTGRSPSSPEAGGESFEATDRVSLTDASHQLTSRVCLVVTTMDARM